MPAQAEFGGLELGQNSSIFAQLDAKITDTDYLVNWTALTDTDLSGERRAGSVNLFLLDCRPTAYLQSPMTTYACPNCQHHIHLPEGVSQTATLQCPMCGHTTLASALAQSAGPTWIVVDPGDPAQPLTAATSIENPQMIAQPMGESNTPDSPSAEPAPTTATNSPSGSTDGTDYELADPNLPKADRTRKQPLKQQDWSKHKPLTHDEYQRRKRKSSSPFAGIVQVVLGGFTALPIAQLLIWHVLGKDPFDLAPKTAAYVPWIVPQKFRPYAPVNDNRFVERSSSRPSSNSSGIARDFDAELAASLAESEKKPARNESQPTEIKEENKTAEKEKTASDPKEKALPDAPVDGVDSVTKDVPVSESEKLSLAIASTKKAMNDWGTIAKEDATKRREVANSFYANLATTVEQFAKIEGEPSARLLKREVEKLGREVSKDAELIQLVRAGGFAKLSKAGDNMAPGSGLALIATFEPTSTSKVPTADSATNEEKNENTSENTSETAPTSEEASAVSAWSLKVRKSVVADAEENAANTQRRNAVLHRDVLLGEAVSGDYLVLAVAHSDSEAEAAEKKRDVIWFAIPLE